MPDTALVDFHCHLDLYPDFEAAVAACEREGVYTLTVTTTPKAWSRNHAVTSKTKYVRAALGLHPQLVGERASEIALWEALLPSTRYVGEVGLDAGPRFYKTFDAQQRVFERVLLACAAAGNKILTIHSVRAARQVLDMIEEHLPRGAGTPVLHWFTGTVAEARRATELGCYFSVNAAMMTDEKRRALVAALPVDRLLTETDGPFTKKGERPSAPVNVIDAVFGLAELLNVPPVEMARMIRANLRRMLGE
ncbi:MAG: TatD family hydrolase [Sphingomonas sp.]|uniref:Qat anti-phage system TatD family nuclease QatD n=1 Tax=Sphingomonas sp. TaxID=28214 RepID=UPI001ACB919F|nr:Qat anti-phage system TatD family nuclease QatD [Sphingomonas sp.]MBN8816528.1 TatD family hydrolase [Sphingomonas sp.]